MAENPAPPVRLPPAAILLTGFLLVLPFYLLIGHTMLAHLEDVPVLEQPYQIPVFGGLCGTALACMLTAHRRRRKNPASGQLWNLALSETPAVLGLVYVYLFREATGLYLLLVIAGAGFVLQSRRDVTDRE